MKPVSVLGPWRRWRTAVTVTTALAIAACDGGGASFSTSFPNQTERVWIGPDFYANRLQDWRLRAGRVEAVEGSVAKPMRTAHLLTHSLADRRAGAVIRVRTGPVTPGPAHADTWSGVLVGAGGPHVDFRISALSHHWPSTDGGLIVAVDGRGRIVVRDNSVNRGIRGPRADIPTDAWPELPPATYEIVDSTAAADHTVHASIEPTGETYRLRVELSGGGEPTLLAVATYDDIPAHQVDGNVALVSHRSPLGEGAGYWFDDLDVRGAKVDAHPDRGFGPIVGAFHTLSDGVLKMTAQLPPLGAADAPFVQLHVRRGDAWLRVDSAEIQPLSATAHFRVEDWPDESVSYRLTYALRTGADSTESHAYEGVIRRPPVDREELVVAAMNCHHISGGDGQWNGQHFWYPHNELVRAVASHEPDMLFFAGDQIYEAGLAGVVRSPADVAGLDYLYHWFRFVWAFRDLARDRPTVMLPDDHDVYHGNVWGNAGVRESGDYTVQDAGGYRMDPAWVNAVHRTQVGNLPDPVDPEPLRNGVTVYHTRLEYAGVSFGIVADRMFKSPPSVVVPQGRVVNGWPQNPAFDAATDADVSGAELLGERQLNFLETWANDWSGDTWMKVLLSQTLFANLATIPDSVTSGSGLPTYPAAGPDEYLAGEKIASDMDSNGWPQSGRNAALRIIRQGFALHVVGDQHLGSLVRYGIDDWNDAGYAFVVPSIANIWPRRWFPPVDGRNRAAGAPRYTGEFLDGFGNKMTVYAVANPRVSGAEPSALYDRSPGYGILRLNRTTRETVAEAWPRWVDPQHAGARQYPGWPVTIPQHANYGRAPVAYLPTLTIEGIDDAVVQIRDGMTDEILYTLRIAGNEFRPWVFDETASYTVAVGEPGTDRWRELRNIRTGEDGAGGGGLRVAFRGQ